MTDVYDCVYQTTDQGCSQSAVSVILNDHSDIRRLGEYMQTSPDLRNLEFSDINVHCVGVRGATIGRRRCIRNYLREVSRHQPFKIFLHIGENDLSHMSEGSVVDELLCLVGELSMLSSSQGCYCESAFTFLSFVQDINTSHHRQLELTNLGFSDVNVHELEEQLLGDAAASGSPSSSITTPALEKFFFTCRGE